MFDFSVISGRESPEHLCQIEHQEDWHPIPGWSQVVFEATRHSGHHQDGQAQGREIQRGPFARLWWKASRGDFLFQLPTALKLNREVSNLDKLRAVARLGLANKTNY